VKLPGGDESRRPQAAMGGRIVQILTLRLVMAAIFAAIGVAGFILALNYEFGTALRMGPGYFPVVLSGALTLLALSEVVSALMKPEAQSIDWRPLVAILSAVTSFGVAMHFFGMIPAFFLVVGITSLSERGYGLLPAVALATVTCVFSWLLFSKFLGMPLALIKWGL
jgi:hypothetical protein